MNKTRTGKIARLPKVVRDVLGDKIEAGTPGAEIVDWLNGLKEVHLVMCQYFGGRLITEQNLSEWRTGGGHRDWLRHEETRRVVREFMATGDDWEDLAGGGKLGDRLSLHLQTELVQMFGTLTLEDTDTPDRWKRLREINQELSRLRRDDAKLAEVRLAQRQQALKESAAQDKTAAPAPPDPAVPPRKAGTRSSPLDSRTELQAMEERADLEQQVAAINAHLREDARITVLGAKFTASLAAMGSEAEGKSRKRESGKAETGASQGMVDPDADDEDELDEPVYVPLSGTTARQFIGQAVGADELKAETNGAQGAMAGPIAPDPRAQIPEPSSKSGKRKGGKAKTKDLRAAVVDPIFKDADKGGEPVFVPLSGTTTRQFIGKAVGADELKAKTRHLQPAVVAPDADLTNPVGEPVPLSGTEATVTAPDPKPAPPDASPQTPAPITPNPTESDLSNPLPFLMPRNGAELDQLMAFLERMAETVHVPAPQLQPDEPSAPQSGEAGPQVESGPTVAAGKLKTGAPGPASPEVIAAGQPNPTESNPTPAEPGPPAASPPARVRRHQSRSPKRRNPTQSNPSQPAGANQPALDDQGTPADGLPPLPDGQKPAPRRSVSTILYALMVKRLQREQAAGKEGELKGLAKS